MVGQTISHYEITEKIGAGGMGVVYKGRDLKLGRPVALKFLPAGAGDKQAIERFEREARTASTLNHPSICTIYEIDEVAGQQFIAMELLEGRTLRELIEAAGHRAAGGGGDSTHTQEEHLSTMSGVAVGTVAYMSPEQARAEELDARSDLFSLGLVLYEMATGVRTFGGSSTAIIFDQILNRVPASPIMLNPTVPTRSASTNGRLLR
jgi:non-specific serine/threonine protein kinase